VSCTGEGAGAPDDEDEEDDEEEEDEDDDDGDPEEEAPDVGPPDEPVREAPVPAGPVPPCAAEGLGVFWTSWVGSDGSPSLQANVRMLSRTAARACEILMKTGCA
jgi:hypothetical protein